MPRERRALGRQATDLAAALPVPGLALQAPGALAVLAGLDGVTLALAAGTFLVVEILLIASVARLWRARPRPAGQVPVRWGWELLWTALPALGLLVLGILGAQTLLGNPPEPSVPGTPTPVAVAARSAAGLVAGQDYGGSHFD
jgi:heme/copper-type cytochrome/quinol oxidase subunit 2